MKMYFSGGTTLNNVKSPISIIHECFKHVDNHKGGSNFSYEISSKEVGKFSCQLTLKWPSEQTFLGTASSKKVSITLV